MWGGVEKPSFTPFSRATCLESSLGFVSWFTSITIWLRLAVFPNLCPFWASILYWGRKVSDALPSLACEPRILRDRAMLMVLGLGVWLVREMSLFTHCWVLNSACLLWEECMLPIVS